MIPLSIRGVGKTFDGSAWVLDRIDLEIAAGELFFLLGPSGCGKSTLLRVIAGLQEPTEGRVFFNDRDVTACLFVSPGRESVRRAECVKQLRRADQVSTGNRRRQEAA